MNEDRLVDLEVHIAHLETAQEELAQALLRQQRLLESLTARLEYLTARVRHQSDGGPGQIDAPASTGDYGKEV